MAGGFGTRFWPSSRVKKPKQFLNLIGERTMIQNTVDRILPIIPIERILIITNSDYISLVQKQFPDLPAENIIGESVAKNTAPCVAAAAAILKVRDPDSTMVVLPADHHITRPERYREILTLAMEKAESGDNLVTLGITPYRPETGYGYIQLDEQQSETMGNDHIYHVKTFAEKPDLKTAISFLESGDFLWNSGMFVWKTSTILEQFKVHLPFIYKETEELCQKLGTQSTTAIDTFYRVVTSISIDYGIMEKAATVHVIPGEFGWSDVGSWMAIYEHGEKDDNGNVVTNENVVMNDTQNCLVRTSSKKLVAITGLIGVGVIETDDTLLIVKLDASQDVKKIVDSLDAANLGSHK
jgi:mannose-1-phosphate guanylyltransferase